MKNFKIKFWDTERKIMLESDISCVTAFRNCLSVASPTSFSNCNNQPEKSRYIPLLFSGVVNFEDKELWDGDLVLFDLLKFYGEGVEDKNIKCEIVFDNSEACFCILPLEESGEFEGYPLLAIGNDLKKIGNRYDNPELL